MEKAVQPFTERIVEVISKIPTGYVLTYGAVAELAGNPRAARQVSWALKSLSGKYKLPWHRVINSKGEISLPSRRGKELQQELLEAEGVKFTTSGKVDLSMYLWQPNE